MKNASRRPWLAWASVGVLAVLCGVLALLQNHWIGEVSRAERDRLQQQLQSELTHLAREFNSEIGSAASSLMPTEAEVDSLGREKAYAARYAEWKQSHDRLFSRIAIAVPANGSLELLSLDFSTGQFSAIPWPVEWSGLENELLGRLGYRRTDGPAPEPFNVLAPPRLGMGRREDDWVVLELNIDYLRGTMLPELLHRYLASGDKLDYQAVVTDNQDPSKLIYESSPDLSGWVRESPDGSVDFLTRDYAAMMRGRGGRMGFRPGPPPPEAPPPGMEPPPPPGPQGEPPPGRGPEGGFRGPGRWRLVVRHQAGSLEAVVSVARWQNLATSLGILVLIIATVAVLVRFSRRAQQLADVQMNFVANVSHELRTPLTVIRTAAFNLRGKLATSPEQVQKYGALIQEESEKLSALVEQVLQFAGARAGHAIRAREPVAIEAVIDDGLRSSGAAESNFVVEKSVAPGLPPVLADQLAMKYAVQNLVENAMKYGSNGDKWIGISATAVPEGNVAAVEVRVADHGPGIPEDEQEHIFEPFFRGRRAVQDQVHGTGLGLNLVKNIVEAHGGTIRVNSEPLKGTEFIMRLPAAPSEAS